MDDERLRRIKAEIAKDYPALIDTKQAAQIAHCPMGTIYSWSSQGDFDEFKIKPGRSVLLDRDAFVDYLMTHAH